jgi:hypothetical protein
MSAIAELRRAVRQLRRRVAARTSPHGDLTRYRLDPAGYARDVLGVQWWDVQVQIAEALLKPPYKVLVLASHAVGKTFLGRTHLLRLVEFVSRNIGTRWGRGAAAVPARPAVPMNVAEHKVNVAG